MTHSNAKYHETRELKQIAAKRNAEINDYEGDIKRHEAANLNSIAQGMRDYIKEKYNHTYPTPIK